MPVGERPARADVTENAERGRQGQQGVGGDEVGGEERQGRGRVDRRGQPGQCRGQPSPDPEQQAHGQREGQRVGRAHRPFVAAELGDAARDRPVGERRLGRVNVVVMTARGDVVAGAQHLHRHLGVAALVGLPQPARSLEGEAERQGAGERQPERVQHAQHGAARRCACRGDIKGVGRHSMIRRETMRDASDNAAKAALRMTERFSFRSHGTQTKLSARMAWSINRPSRRPPRSGRGVPSRWRCACRRRAR
jgi:hypothetical protein